MKIVHVITRLILGGAQENTLLSVDDQHYLWHDDATLITGPAIGPEGSLIERARARPLDLRIIPERPAETHPLRNGKSYRQIVRLCRKIKPKTVHTHSSKAGILGRAAAHKLRIPVSTQSMGLPFTPFRAGWSTRLTGAPRNGP